MVIIIHSQILFYPPLFPSFSTQLHTASSHCRNLHISSHHHVDKDNNLIHTGSFGNCKMLFWDFCHLSQPIGLLLTWIHPSIHPSVPHHWVDGSQQVTKTLTSSHNCQLLLVCLMCMYIVGVSCSGRALGPNWTVWGDLARRYPSHPGTLVSLVPWQTALAVDGIFLCRCSKSLRFRRWNHRPQHASHHGILSILTFYPTAVMQCVVFSSGVEPSLIFLLPTTVLPEKKRSKFLLLCVSRGVCWRR